MKTTMINGTRYTYQDAKYNDVDSRVTGKNLYHSFMFEPLPTTKQELMDKQKIMSIMQLAMDKMLAIDPTAFDLNYYGNWKKGTHALLRQQIQTTLFWSLNKQPRSFTMYVDRIDTKIEDMVKMLIQNGVIANVCIPATGYVCSIQPVCNKKQMIIFSKEFMCEVYKQQHEAGLLQDTDVLNNLNTLYEKCIALADYRSTIQSEIWKQVNYALVEHQDDWKCQNIYTMESRVQYAIKQQTSDILSKYAYDFKLDKDHAITVDDITQPEQYEHMVEQLAQYGRAFGISVKTTESTSEVNSYMPTEWMRNKLSESSRVKQAYRIQQGLKRAPLNELVQAYLQLDWYMNQPDRSAFMEDGYSTCHFMDCGNIISKHDEFCPKCGMNNEQYEPDTLNYDTNADCVKRNWTEELI